MTQTQARLMTPLPRRLPDRGDRPGRIAQPGRGQRPKPGRWARDTRPCYRCPHGPTVRPAERIVKTSSASNLKSQSVVFGISRLTRAPRWRGRRPLAGLPRPVARDRQAGGSRQPVVPRLHVRAGREVEQATHCPSQQSALHRGSTPYPPRGSADPSAANLGH